VPKFRGLEVTRDEYRELVEAARAIRADAAARRARGWPRRLPCLGCGRRRWSTSPSDRFCDACRRAAASDSLGAVPTSSH